MPSARSILLQSSNLSTGNEARLHLNNLKVGLVNSYGLPILCTNIIINEVVDIITVSDYSSVMTITESETTTLTTLEDETTLRFDE